MTIIIASNNSHKINEIRSIFTSCMFAMSQNIDLTMYAVAEFFPSFDPAEIGSSFLQNSLIKAEALYDLVCKNAELFARTSRKAVPIILADDSGISVEALNGAPGVYSARFGKDELGALPKPSEQNDLLLEKLKGIPPGKKRSARYHCCMTAIIPPQDLFGGKDNSVGGNKQVEQVPTKTHKRLLSVEECWEGEVALSASKAKGGFGYDPIFLLPERGLTVAEISAEEKQTQSHRGKSLRRIAKQLLHIKHGGASCNP